MDKRKFSILFNSFAIPVSRLAETYKNSALTIDNNLKSEKVAKAFDELVKALSEQLNKYRE